MNDTPTIADTIRDWITTNTRVVAPYGLTIQHSHLDAETMGRQAFDQGNVNWWAIYQLDNRNLALVDPTGARYLARWADATGHPIEAIATAGPGTAYVVDLHTIDPGDGRRLPWTTATAASHGVPSPGRDRSVATNQTTDRIRIDFTTEVA